MKVARRKEKNMSRLLSHYANLHTHSTHSDGRYAPDELVRIAKEIGSGAIARDQKLFISGVDDHSGLLGGQYYRFKNPEETKYYFPPPLSARQNISL